MSFLKHKKRPPHHEAGHAGHESETLHAIVEAYNYSPKGDIDGVLLREGDRIVQVNLPPHLGIAISLTIPVGQSIEATVEPEPELRKHPEGEHPVYRLVALKAPDGRSFALDSHSPEKTVTVEGVVNRLNYARHGEANGVILESGDFLHLKPDGMKRVGLSVGETIRAEGRARLTPLGTRAIEADVVNGIPLGPRKPAR
ncbi:MAG: hypothetical protein ACLQGP_02160 [Isosphaeraceae bacterium]